MAKSERKELKIKLDVDSMESVDSVEFVENMELVENVDSVDSVDLTGISGLGVSQLYCSFDVALMQLCYCFDAGLGEGCRTGELRVIPGSWFGVRGCWGIGESFNCRIEELRVVRGSGFEVRGCWGIAELNYPMN